MTYFVPGDLVGSTAPWNEHPLDPGEIWKIVRGINASSIGLLVAVKQFPGSVPGSKADLDALYVFFPQLQKAFWIVATSGVYVHRRYESVKR